MTDRTLAEIDAEIEENEKFAKEVSAALKALRTARRELLAAEKKRAARVARELLARARENDSEATRILSEYDREEASEEAADGADSGVVEEAESIVSSTPYPSNFGG